MKKILLAGAFTVVAAPAFAIVECFPTADLPGEVPNSWTEGEDTCWVQDTLGDQAAVAAFHAAQQAAAQAEAEQQWGIETNDSAIMIRVQIINTMLDAAGKDPIVIDAGDMPELPVAPVDPGDDPHSAPDVPVFQEAGYEWETYTYYADVRYLPWYNNVWKPRVAAYEAAMEAYPAQVAAYQEALAQYEIRVHDVETNIGAIATMNGADFNDLLSNIQAVINYEEPDNTDGKSEDNNSDPYDADAEAEAAEEARLAAEEEAEANAEQPLSKPRDSGICLEAESRANSIPESCYAPE